MIYDEIRRMQVSEKSVFVNELQSLVCKIGLVDALQRFSKCSLAIMK